MKKQQQKMQLVLIFIGFFLILLTYFYYPYMEKNKLLKDQSAREDLEKTLEDDHSTAFENIEYQGLYDLDKPFSVKSEKAHILADDPNLVLRYPEVAGGIVSAVRNSLGRSVQSQFFSLPERQAGTTLHLGIVHERC